MARLFANSGDPDQMPHSAIWVCTVCQLLFYGSTDYNGLTKKVLIFFLIPHKKKTKKKTCCGYTLEVPQRGASICFCGEIRKISILLD